MKQKYLDAFIDMTLRFAKTSEATRLHVGACLLKDGNPIAFGVNGTIPGWEDNNCELPDGSTNEYAVLHAEINLLNKLRKIGESSVGCTLLVTHSPCLPCALQVIDAGITSVIYLDNYRSDAGIKKLIEKGVKVEKYYRTGDGVYAPDISWGNSLSGMHSHVHHGASNGREGGCTCTRGETNLPIEETYWHP